MAAMETLVLPTEFQKHEDMLVLLLDAIKNQEHITNAIHVAESARNHRVIQSLINRLDQLAPASAAGLQERINRRGRFVAAEVSSDALDKEEDQYLATLEEDENSDDHNWIHHDSATDDSESDHD
jgi:hypothetical protein